MGYPPDVVEAGGSVETKEGRVRCGSADAETGEFG
jgi:hypothetical protein